MKRRMAFGLFFLCLLAALAIVVGIAGWLAVRDASLREITVSVAAQAQGTSSYRPKVEPGSYSWASERVVAEPVGRGGVVIRDYGHAVWVANLTDESPKKLPASSTALLAPLNEIHVRPGEAEAVWWDPRLQLLGLQRGDLSVITCYGNSRKAGEPIEVPLHSVYAARADMWSRGFVGCTAAVITNGDIVLFAHCLPKDGGIDLERGPESVTVYNLLDYVEGLLEIHPGPWKAHIAAGSQEDLDFLRDGLSDYFIEIPFAMVIGDEGHGAYYCRRTGRLNVFESIGLVREADVSLAPKELRLPPSNRPAYPKNTRRRT